MPTPSTENAPGRLLVVDDQAFFRNKIGRSLTTLGYLVETVSSGTEAISHARTRDIDVILLDLLMPDMDGYAVIRKLQNDQALKNVPIIVISALQEDTASVVEAIKLGAEDFLPKDYSQQILQARVNACLRKKRNRDQELDRLSALQRLMNATDLLEQGTYNPSKLGLDAIANRGDAVATLTAVFSRMAQQIYDRERKLRQNINTLKGLFLLVFCGLIFGLDAPIAKLMSQFNAHPLGVSIWISVVACLLTLPYSIYKKDIPPFTWSLFKYFLIWGFCTCVLGDVFLLIAAEQLQASVLSIILVLEVLLVFAYSAITKLEKATTKRFLGLVIGLAGVAMAVYAQESTGTTVWWYALAAIAVPAGYAAIDILIVVSKQVDMKPMTTLGIASLFGLLIMIPIAWHQEGFVSVSFPPGKFELGILVWGTLTVVGMLLLVLLITTAGAVFGSQAAYVMTLAGIFWSILLLGESLTTATWLALGVICIGLLLVEPKQEAEEEVPEDVLKSIQNDSPVIFE